MLTLKNDYYNRRIQKHIISFFSRSVEYFLQKKLNTFPEDEYYNFSNKK